jgi:DNA-binding NarL/FixJ family response regulator
MSSLSGKRILVLEDEAIIAIAIEDILMTLGAEVIGPATTIEDAIHLVQSDRIDAALLDLNLNGKHSDSVAEMLTDRSVPFVFASGYGSECAQRWPNTIVLQKPYRADHVAAALAKAMAGEGAEMRLP